VDFFKYGFRLGSASVESKEGDASEGKEIEKNDEFDSGFHFYFVGK